jgi:hypothetical protein
MFHRTNSTQVVCGLQVVVIWIARRMLVVSYCSQWHNFTVTGWSGMQLVYQHSARLETQGHVKSADAVCGNAR